MKQHDPVPEYLKVVTILDARPGYADKRGGEPIGILTLEHAGEIEQPLMLRLRDVELLIDRLSTVLEFHDITRHDQSVMTSRSDTTIIEYKDIVPRPAQKSAPLVITGDVRESNTAESGELSKTDLKLRVQHTNGKISVYDIFGGYHDAETTALLVRFYGEGDKARKSGHDTMVIVRRPSTVLFRGFKATEMIGLLNWKRFGLLTEGADFIIRGRQWTKLREAELKALVGTRRVFKVAYN